MSCSLTMFRRRSKRRTASCPDRRILDAVASIYEWSTGQKQTVVEIDFQDGEWQIRCAGEDAGRLPELANFSQSLDMLARWSAKLRARRSQARPLTPAQLAAIDSEIQGFTPPHLFSAIDRIAKQMAGRSFDAASAQRAAHALAMLIAASYGPQDYTPSAWALWDLTRWIRQKPSWKSAPAMMALQAP